MPYLRAKSKELYDIWGGNEPSELFRDQEQSVREVCQLMLPYSLSKYKSAIVQDIVQEGVSIR